jgi:hypothetical protein
MEHPRVVFARTATAGQHKEGRNDVNANHGELLFCDGRFVDPQPEMFRPFIRKPFIHSN